jgi:methyl-accepting chemotaxis protein
MAHKGAVVMTRTREKVEGGSKALSGTPGVFNRIAGSIGDITLNAMDVASVSQEQGASIEEVTPSTNVVPVLIVDTSKEAGDASAATEEVSVSTGQISRIVSSMSNTVGSVSAEMTSFKK